MINKDKHLVVEGWAGKLALAFALTSALAFAQDPVFTPGNLVVVVEGCGVHATGAQCTSAPYGNGNGTQNSSADGYGDNQAAPLTLFQYTPSGATSVSFAGSLVLPQNVSGANFPVTGEYGSSSDGTLQLSGNGQFLTLGGYGLNPVAYNSSPLSYTSYVDFSKATSFAQSGSLTGQSYTAVPRVVALIDATGNVNSSTALYNVFNQNNIRSAFTVNGASVYVSGQGSTATENGTPAGASTLDNTGGVFYSLMGATNTAPTSITGNDAGTGESQETNEVQILSIAGSVDNNTLLVSNDSKEGSTNRDYIGTLGTLGTPPASLANSANGPTQLSGFGASNGKGGITITSATTNGVNTSGSIVNLSPQNYFFASPSVLYVADSGSPKNTSGSTSSLGDGGLQKWIYTSPITFTGAVTKNSTTVTAPSGTFSSADVGQAISDSAGDIPTAAIITAVASSTSATMSAEATKADATDSITIGGWTLQYTLAAGLGLVPNSNSDGTTGLYGLAGLVVGSGPTATVYLYATSYTLADLDTTYLYGITDTLGTATNPGTSFTVLDTAPSDSNFKGVSFAPAIPAGGVEVTSTPSGLTFTSSGASCAQGTYTTPQEPIWTPGSMCTLSVVTPQYGPPGVQYVFIQWADGTTTTSDMVAAPSSPATYTAEFATLSVQSTGLVYNRVQKRGTETVTITNTGGLTLAGPVQLVLSGLPAGVTAVNNTGATQGNPYWTVTAGSLAPGASAQVAVTLSYALGTNVTATSIVYSGSLP